MQMFDCKVVRNELNKKENNCQYGACEYVCVENFYVIPHTNRRIKAVTEDSFRDSFSMRFEFVVVIAVFSISV